MTSWRWGRPGDDYINAGGFNGRGQLVRLRYATDALRGCRGLSFCGIPIHCCAWRVGYHAGRVFARREQARDAT